jgi:hypothetical protein
MESCFKKIHPDPLFLKQDKNQIFLDAVLVYNVFNSEIKNLHRPTACMRQKYFTF